MNSQPSDIMLVDALRTERCYKPALSHERSYTIILDSAGTHLDPEVVNAFSQIEGQFDSVHEKLLA